MMWVIAAVLDTVIMALVMSVVGLWIITQLRIWRVRQSQRRASVRGA
jgi:hypothetical protein